jgi:hypothetical protein
MSEKVRKLALLAMPVVVAGQMLCASAAKADTVSILGFEIDSMSIQGKLASGANGFTGIHDTGDLSLRATGRTTVDIGVDGVKEETLASQGAGTTFDLMGDIRLINGDITGGVITLIARLGNANETYQFNVAPGTGSLHKVPLVNSYLLAGLTYNGIFNSGDFGGVDVGFWRDQQPVIGSFLQFDYNPTSSGLDQSANLDVAVFGESFSQLQTPDGRTDPVPLPKTVWGGAVLMMGWGLTQRRGRAVAVV